MSNAENPVPHRTLRPFWVAVTGFREVEFCIVMRGIKSIILKKFRCFKEEQEAVIRPITILVGENSTGKTSFLGSCQALDQILSGRPLDFNEPPLHMGAFSDLLNGKGDQFNIGYDFLRNKKSCRVTLSFSEQSSSGCRISSVALELDGSASIGISVSEENNILVSVPKGDSIKLSRTRNYNGPVDIAAKLVFSLLVVSMQKKTNDKRLSEHLIEMEAGLSHSDIFRLPQNA